VSKFVTGTAHPNTARQHNLYSAIHDGSRWKIQDRRHTDKRPAETKHNPQKHSTHLSFVITKTNSLVCLSVCLSVTFALRNVVRK